MKKVLALSLIVLFLFSLAACGDNVESVIKSRVKKNYSFAKIESLEINNNISTDDPDDIVVVTRLAWDVYVDSDPQSTLETYSSDLAATVAEKCPSVSKIAIYWTTTNLNGSLMCVYDRNGDKMYLSDINTSL